MALFLYLFFDGLMSLYVISALFGLFQGGIVPMYAVIVREFFAPQEAGTRLGLVVMATLGGMLSAAGRRAGSSTRPARTRPFLNGLGWNLVNVTIVGWLMLRANRRVRGGLI